MAYTIELLENEPILVATWHRDFRFQDELEPFMVDMFEALNAQQTPIDMIHVFETERLALNDIIAGASISTRGEASVFKHKNIRRILFVTEQRALQLAAKGLNTVGFGNVDISVFESLDEALKYARCEAA